jgi:uncharacterized integral membrane protein (TIGR00697 family)
MKKMVSVPYMLMGILFCVSLVVSNLLETKVISLGPLTATAGMLVFPISYIINDCIVEVWGYRKARFIIWTGFAVNFAVVCLTQLAIRIPSPDFWEGEASFNFVFGLNVRIVAASLCAFLAGSFLNALVMSKMKILSKGKNFSLRAVVSTVVGESADSLIFFPIAFAGLLMTNDLLIMMLTQVFLKSLYEIIVLPLTVVIVKYVKKIDGSDVYDSDISFNPFNMREM